MKQFFKTYLVLFFVLSTHLGFSYETDSAGIVKPQYPPKLVNDFAALFSAEQTNELENILVAYNDSTSTQIAVITIDSLHDLEISEYALQLGRSWGIGQQGKDNGLIILISKNDRAINIEVGYGLEAYLTDYDCKRIIENNIVPQFKVGNYYQGVYDAVTTIQYIIQNYPGNAYAVTPIYPKSFLGKVLEYIPMVFPFLLIFMFIVIGLILTPSGGSTYSSSGWKSSSSSSYSSTSSYSSSSSSSSSSRSFGGYGGGSFGGGGASGKW